MDGTSPEVVAWKEAMRRLRLAGIEIKDELKTTYTCSEFDVESWQATVQL
jgi:hypothetical protein